MTMNDPMTPADVSASFVSARRTATALRDFPGKLPDDLDAAYRIQDRSIDLWPDTVAGWKIGGIPQEYRQAFGAERLAGPIFARSVRQQGAGAVAMAVFEGGFAAVEAEIVLKVGEAIAPGTLRSEDPATAIASAFIGVEIASSPLGQINDLGPTSIVSDFGNNAGLIVGAAIDGWRAGRETKSTVRVLINDEVAGEAAAPDISGSPLTAFVFLTELCEKRGITIPAGALISTGAITGVHQAQAGDRAVCDFGPLGRIALTLEAANPDR